MAHDCGIAAKLPIMRSMMRTRTLVPLIVLFGPLLPSSAAARSSHTVDAIASASLGAQGIAVQMRGKPFGVCRGTALTVPGGATFKTNCGGGRVTVAIHFGERPSKGTWKITNATGRYRGGSGRGTFDGSLTTLRFRLRGSVRY